MSPQGVPGRPALSGPLPLPTPMAGGCPSPGPACVPPRLPGQGSQVTCSNLSQREERQASPSQSKACPTGSPGLCTSGGRTGGRKGPPRRSPRRRQQGPGLRGLKGPCPVLSRPPPRFRLRAAPRAGEDPGAWGPPARNIHADKEGPCSPDPEAGPRPDEIRNSGPGRDPGTPRGAALGSHSRPGCSGHGHFPPESSWPPPPCLSLQPSLHRAHGALTWTPVLSLVHRRATGTPGSKLSPQPPGARDQNGACSLQEMSLWVSTPLTFKENQQFGIHSISLVEARAKGTVTHHRRQEDRQRCTRRRPLKA